MKRRVVLNEPCQAGQHHTRIARVRKSFNNAEEADCTYLGCGFPIVCIM